ncbi:MAG: response regulator [Alphaproteobacteria bacterium]|nr:response regulator [Alphaproteobacteria bacterium]
MSTVLVVDDEFGIAEVVEMVLVQRGHRVLSAYNGKQGLELAIREAPDLMIVDVMMPVLSGPALIAALRDNRATRVIPVIVISSLHQDALAIPANNYAGYLRKPFSIRDLAALVDRLLAPQPRP